MTIYYNLVEYFKGSRAELKKVVWPTRAETIRYTLLVIGISLGVAVILGLFDILFAYIIKTFLI